MSATDSARPAESSRLVKELLARVVERVEPDRADVIREFARAYVRRMPGDVLSESTSEELFGQVLGAFEHADRRRGRPIAVRAFNPTLAADGYTTVGSVVETNTEDSPFLVDSVTEELAAHGLDIRLVVHPVVGTERDGDGAIVRLLHSREALASESVMHFEIDEHLGRDVLAELERDVERVLKDVQAAVHDFGEMQERVPTMIEAAEAGSARYAADEVEETVDFLKWLLDGNFVFLGYREYGITEDALAVVAGSGLGILADETGSHYASPTRLGSIEPKLRSRIVGGDLLLVSKTNRVSTVHRRVKMDYIGVKSVSADGDITGELRLIGLFTRKAYMEPAGRSPILRRKLKQIVETEDLIEGSHDYKEVLELFESFPKDELFAAGANDLRRTVMGLLELQERRDVRLFVRPDLDGRRVAVLIALPRDRFNARLRRRLQDLVRARFHGSWVDYHLSLGDTDPAQIHFTVHVEGEVPEVSFSELEQDVVAITRTWDDRLTERLIALHGEERGRQLAEKYSERLPDYYKSGTDIYLSVLDIEQFESLEGGEAFTVALQNERGAGENLTRIGLYKTGGKVKLSDFMPILEHLGLTVVEEVPTRLLDSGGETYLHDFGVLGENGGPLDLQDCGDRVADCISAVWLGKAESDSLNRLVVTAGLSWQQVVVLRAYRKYRQRVGAAFNEEYRNDAFARNPHIARKFIRLFELRFDPEREAHPDAEEALREEILADLDAVKSLDEDRILRAQLNLIDATVRTNAFLPDRTYVSFKLASRAVLGLPEPAPLYEIFVYAPEMEGIHLRGGKVARGGIRWSTRLEDYRTEVLDLMKAQMVKNAVIVPVGSKGGFVLRRPPAEPAKLSADVEHQYATLIRGMLDLTDNLIDGEVIHPRDVRVLDEDDPYLVVAADKGTATFSDAANAISADYGFWLGDAFASGGSAGYDHRKLGITARGVWESVKRHFRELGHDVMAEPFAAVGIGDMSGDVFGNGMLYTEQIRLVAAFDHRHIFIDPDPDSTASLAERQRLFDQAESSWDDYDRSKISTGGGVWSRADKWIELSAEAREILGVDFESGTPNEVISAILRAPVDLFWNGGVGTFVKATTESHEEVGDRTNDAVRVNGSEVRARVVCEGGNLGFTQNGRIEFANKGGRINTDAIDNSAGVDTSDHEVNLKILLGMAVANGDLTTKQRNDLLREVENDVAGHVIYDNYLQAQILSQEEAVSAERIEAYEDLMTRLESEGLLDRELETLPSSEEMVERRAGGRGMARPELCVLLAYAKRSLESALRDSKILDDPFLDLEMMSYFPSRVAERFGHLLGEHPLRRDLLATAVANDVVDSEGITFVSRFASETGAEPAEVARAYWIARHVTGAVDRWSVVEGLDGKLDPVVQNVLMVGVDDLVEDIAHWYLVTSPGAPIGETIEATAPRFAELARVLDRAGSDVWRETHLEVAQDLESKGVSPQLAHQHAFQPELAHGPDIIAVARDTGRDLENVARAFFLAGEHLHIDWLEDRLEQLPDDSRWQRWAVEAMTDDLMMLRREAAVGVLRNEAASVEEALEAYLSERADGLERLSRLIGTLGLDGTPSLAPLTVALRQIRSVVVQQSSSSGTWSGQG